MLPRRLLETESTLHPPRTRALHTAAPTKPASDATMEQASSAYASAVSEATAIAQHPEFVPLVCMFVLALLALNVCTCCSCPRRSCGFLTTVVLVPLLAAALAIPASHKSLEQAAIVAGGAVHSQLASSSWVRDAFAHMYVSTAQRLVLFGPT